MNQPYDENPAIEPPPSCGEPGSPRVTPLPLAYQEHGRHWRRNLYCYPVVSRRSGGLSLGVNLNPDKACNFDCVYCQVDRTTPPEIRKVDLNILRQELDDLLDRALGGSLFSQPPFDCLGPDLRSVRDIAFSGDGEPTTCPQFGDAVAIAVEARRGRALHDTKLVLITNACYLTRPTVQEALRVLDGNNGEIWAKLDAGTESHFAKVNRGTFPLRHVLDNITDAARVRPIVIQSMWMRLHGAPPAEDEVAAFVDHLAEIVAAGGGLRLVQIYTVARHTAEPDVTALTAAELDAIAAAVRRRVSAPVEVYCGAGG